MRWALRSIVVVLALLAAACGGGGDGDEDETGAGTEETSSGDTVAEASATTSEAASSGGGSGRDACAALPRPTIQQVVGADPGEGELETAGGSTVCRYFGEAEVTVEIDPVADLASARTSIEAYGETCEDLDGIGGEALFCRGGFKAMGFTGQVVWTEAGRTYYVVYNFGQAEPSKDVTLQLAKALED
ncbi:MAG TPA: hypothetical protein VFO65_01950 [Acidimicrobiales bacterium]|nr:hypothetical protein [Acidimicrobiales bacterium]